MTDAERTRAYRESRSLSLSIPSKEAELVPWLLHFASAIASDPQRFLTDPQHARQLAQLVETYAAAYRKTLDPDTATGEAITMKLAYRAAAVKAVRTHARWIKVQPSISVEDKVRVGFVLQAVGRR